MRFIIDKRNYIILFIIIILLFWILLLQRKNTFVKSFKIDNKIVTYIIYDDINEKEVYNKIKKIYGKYENYSKKLNGKLDKNMIDFLKYSKKIYKKTNGYIDITNGANKDYDLIIDNKLKKEIDFNIDNIIASYATSFVISYFNLKEIRKYIINIDGDIIASDGYDSNYHVSISDPSNNKILKIISISNKSMTTINNGIINPKTGKLENNYDSLVVIADDILTSNMVANYIYFLSLDEGKELADIFNCDIFWYKNGEIFTTDNFSKYFA